MGTIWMGSNYNRKPTGMLCINSTLYLAFQNLNEITFNDAPAASIAKSTDHGYTCILKSCTFRLSGYSNANLSDGLGGFSEQSALGQEIRLFVPVGWRSLASGKRLRDLRARSEIGKGGVNFHL